MSGRSSRGTAPRRTPAFVKLAPSDDASDLLPIFFEHPETYTKHVGPDGRIRSWGFYPYIPPGERGEGHEDIQYYGPRKMKTQAIYGSLGQTTLARPEDQFMSVVLTQKKRELKELDLGDLTRRDYFLRIHMPEIPTTNGEDRIWRRFVVSGGMSLGVLQDKILAPLMGWVRNFHVHILTDVRDGAQFGPKNSTAVDIMHLDSSAYDFLNEDHYCLAHILSKVGDELLYEYDLGDHYRHIITVLEKIAPLEESYGRVQILSGSGICPMENGRGNSKWAEHIDTLTKPGSTLSQRRELLAQIYSEKNYTDRGWDKKLGAKFDPDYFDLAETTQAVMTALGTKLSYSPGAKAFKIPFTPEALMGQSLMPSKHKTTREVTLSPGDEFGFYEELKKDGRDSRRATACAACGNPNDLKACSGCGQRFYCGRACQTAHWKSTHKRECAAEKAKRAAS
ncbi:MYND-type domain-containing protein [Favolaschia claudopus]|uniref:MYND-type domain-containing protein n=1 Tax=Favolaschia claudopus TaxID=2862362 RepID=A0AAW0CSC4_9AGAR